MAACATSEGGRPKNHLHDARKRGFLDDRETERIVRLTLRAIKASVHLAIYLENASAPIPFSSERGNDLPRNVLDTGPPVLGPERIDPEEPEEPG